MLYPQFKNIELQSSKLKGGMTCTWASFFLSLPHKHPKEITDQSFWFFCRFLSRSHPLYIGYSGLLQIQYSFSAGIQRSFLNYHRVKDTIEGDSKVSTLGSQAAAIKAMSQLSAKLWSYIISTHQGSWTFRISDKISRTFKSISSASVL